MWLWFWCLVFVCFGFVFLKGKLPNDYPEEILGYVEERLQRYSVSAELCVCTRNISLANFHWSFQNSKSSSFSLNIFSEIVPLLHGGFWFGGFFLGCWVFWFCCLVFFFEKPRTQDGCMYERILHKVQITEIFFFSLKCVCNIST